MFAYPPLADLLVASPVGAIRPSASVSASIIADGHQGGEDQVVAELISFAANQRPVRIAITRVFPVYGRSENRRK